MRVNVYAEEMTDRIQIIEKTIDGKRFTGLRFYLELPVSYTRTPGTAPRAINDKNTVDDVFQLRGPFIHKPGDDDSGAVTFWGKRDLRDLLKKALQMLDEHYAPRKGKDGSEGAPSAPSP